MTTYTPKTTPWPKQAEALRICQDAPLFALLMEQRTGKTKVIIDKASRHYEQHGLDGLIIVAMPSGVAGNWVTDEIPAHMPDRIPRLGYVWHAAKAKQKAHLKQQQDLLTFKGIPVLAVNGEAIITEAFRKFGDKFLKTRKRVMIVGDETSLIMKAVGTKRFRVMDSMGKKYPSVKWKVILDGTPTEHGPLDMFSQIGWLSRKIFGFDSYYAFKHRYAVWEKGYNHNTGTEYETQKRDKDGQLIFSNMDEFHAKLAPYVFRARRSEVFTIPDKTYEKVVFDLTKEQARVYADLEEQYEAELSTGEKVSATMVLTRYTRLQQICSNYWPERSAYEICPMCDGNGCEHCDDIGAVEITMPARAIDTKRNPRLLAHTALVEKHGYGELSIGDMEDGVQRGPIRQIIHWARFRQDVTDIMNLLESMGRKPVRYDGQVPADQKAANKLAFANGEATDFVGSPAAGGRGLKIVAPTHIYYSNSFSLLARLQSEDRSEVNDDRKHGTHIIDIVARDTLDDKVIHPALRDKKRIADIVVKDPHKAWI